ncbi:APC family permease [Stakelama pacifica]|uniref:Amino acid/polyamine/organocation transporter (APC superfamily) n=1 Tax=Stakelama pacifica TaxID=517720 RepID=A0A4R6FCT6_9SPHN|nr:APC family permease [Stakelama pacifica]TDN78430.1 amino acid/polyamine/organocation transporter (APC superfamily) [Stakelama pacifica]GGO99595.1 amino acid permease [Stakelama pacifica]
MTGEHDHSSAHRAHEGAEQQGSISLSGAVAMGTGVMIGAGIFALTGQIAELAGPLFPLSFIAGAFVTALAAYSYVKMSDAWPSSGGIAMILQKAYGPGTIAGSASVLMALSMVINESLVARTFATYALRPFGEETNGLLLSVLALALIVFAYLVNAAGNRSVSTASLVMSAIKIGGIAIFAIAALWASGFSGGAFGEPATGFKGMGFVASIAFSILAFKGFTTITNSGGEIVDPHRNVGRTIMIAIGICVVTYLLVAVAVGSSLSIERIVEARDYSLAAAAEPALGPAGFWFTVVIAVTATASGVVASVFAVSRMLTMLTEMKLIPHSHFGMKGSLRSHLLVYTVVMAGTLAVLFDLTRIAALGAFFYLVMDMLVHWGVFRHLRRDVGARGAILLAAMAADGVVLAAFSWVKLKSDPMVVLYAAIGIVLVFAGEHFFLRRGERRERETS